jgi:hypothetical protein
MTGGKENQTEGIEITVFSMKKLPDGSSTIAEKGEEAHFWDICVRDANSDWIDGVEDLTRAEEIDENIAWLLEKYPDASLEYVW